MTLLTAPPDVQRQMRNYCGSVCHDSTNQIFAVSSPRGVLVTICCCETGMYLGKIYSQDACGVAPGAEAGTFWISNGFGIISEVKVSQAFKSVDSEILFPGSRWDNHMVVSIT